MKNPVYCSICEESNSVVGEYDEIIGFSSNEYNLKKAIVRIIEAKTFMPIEFRFLNINCSGDNKLYAVLGIKRTNKTIYEFK